MDHFEFVFFNQSNFKKTTGNPTSINYLNKAEFNLICTTEDSHVCLWDLKQKNPLIKRIYVSSERLVCSSFGDSMLATAGESRSVYMIDSSSWCVSDVWSNCSKYEITSIDFPKANESLVYVSGLNSEILCGSWKNKKGLPKRRLKERNKSFKADSNWIGIKQNESNGDLIGITETGNLYIIENPISLEIKSQDESPKKNHKNQKK